MGNGCSCGITVVSDATTLKQRNRAVGVDYEDDCLPTVPRSRVNLRDGPTPSSFDIEEHALPHQPERLEESMIFPGAFCEVPTLPGDNGDESVETACEPDVSCIGNPLSHQTDSSNASNCSSMLHPTIPVPAAMDYEASASSSTALPLNYTNVSLLGASCASQVSAMSRPVSPLSGVSSSCDARQTQVSFRSYAFVLRNARVSGDESSSPISTPPVTRDCFDEPTPHLSMFAPAAAHCSSTASTPFARSVSCHSDVESLCEEVGIAPSQLVPLLPPTSPQRHQIALRRKRSCAAVTLSGSRRPHLREGVHNVSMTSVAHADEHEFGFAVSSPCANTISFVSVL
jgi:hypothetical protein